MDRRFAEMFIERIKKDSDCRLLVTNREGTIIAATEKERVGVFHEACFIMMRDSLEMFVVRPDESGDYLGVKYGIDMPIVIEGETIGAIGITGVPEEVKPTITMVKITLEAMLEFELYKEKTQRKNSDQEAFFSLLLNNRLGRSEQLLSMAKRLGYRSDVTRIPIVFLVEGAVSATLSQITGSDAFGSQDFAFLNRDGEIIVFHHLTEKPVRLFCDYRQSVHEFIEPIARRFERLGIKNSYYVGSIQRNLSNYSFAYKHCCWLIDNQLPAEFIYDHVDEYLKDQTPMLELNGLFQAVLSSFDESMVNNYSETVNLLSKHNYNLVSSSKELFVHKNTLLFRLNKIREFLGLNPIQNASDRAFMDYLGFYIGIQRKSTMEPSPL